MRCMFLIYYINVKGICVLLIIKKRSRFIISEIKRRLKFRNIQRKFKTRNMVLYGLPIANSMCWRKLTRTYTLWTINDGSLRKLK